MKIISKIAPLMFGIFYNLISLGAFLKNVPVKIKQPNGFEIEAFATGDEFYNWLQDKDGYTIIPNTKTGYYCYAIIQNDTLIPSEHVAGIANPKTIGLKHNVNLPLNEILKIKTEKQLYFPSLKPFSKKKDKEYTSKYIQSNIDSTQTILFTQIQIHCPI